ncbi:AraC family transcriptional regulator [Salipaludibacillus sp. HK11]|uniref:AraC family transcriptional regulator n=1 Tax=Salipaludibacillus sp. HK11 TaxID=3394320 RepID=UPI0039FC8230
MDLLKGMNDALHYIEEKLTDRIDFKEVAKRAYCSEYHFKRMFSFLAGVTLSEYIRRRRLTLAAFELKDRGVKVIDVAVKYGYTSPDSFAKAFQSLHGVTPTTARDHSHSLKAYPRMTFQLSIKGGAEMNYRIEQKQAFRTVGIKNRINLQGSGNNPEIERIIDAISDDTYVQLEGLSDLDPSGVIHICTNFFEESSEFGELDYYVAAATTKSAPNTMATLDVPALTWAVFEVDGPWEEVQEVWERVYSEWFPSSGYEHVEGPEILASTDTQSEIWIPVVKQ